MESEPKRILVPGVFDLFSTSEMKMLEKLKSNPKKFIIVVGVYDDHDLKENLFETVMTGYERSETIKHCRYVDEIIFPCPYLITKEFLEANKIYAVVGEKMNENFGDVTEKFLSLDSEDGVGSREIIDRVLNEFDEYAERTLSRGYAYQEIGLNEVEAVCLFLRLVKKKIQSK